MELSVYVQQLLQSYSNWTQWLLQLRSELVMGGPSISCDLRLLKIRLRDWLARVTGVTEHNTKPCRFFVLWLTCPWVGRTGFGLRLWRPQREATVMSESVRRARKQDSPPPESIDVQRHFCCKVSLLLPFGCYGGFYTAVV